MSSRSEIESQRAGILEGQSFPRPVSVRHCHAGRKSGRICRVKYWQTIAENLSKAGWSWGCIKQRQ
jgi:hypothetical protein